MVDKFFFSIIYDVVCRHILLPYQLRMILFQPFSHHITKLLRQGNNFRHFLLRNHADHLIITDITFLAEFIEFLDCLSIRFESKSQGLNSPVVVTLTRHPVATDG